MTDLDPKMIKAFVLLGMFRGRIPPAGPGGFLTMEITEEALSRVMREVEDLEFELIPDHTRCCVKLVAYRVEDKAKRLLREAIERDHQLALEYEADDNRRARPEVLGDLGGWD